MATIRVHEIAKKLALEPRDVLLKLRAEGIPVASNLSIVDVSCVDLIKKVLAQPKKAAPKKKAARAPRKKPPAAKKKVAKAAPKKKAAKKVAAKAPKKKAARKAVAKPAPKAPEVKAPELPKVAGAEPAAASGPPGPATPAVAPRKPEPARPAAAAKPSTQAPSPVQPAAAPKPPPPPPATVKPSAPGPQQADTGISPAAPKHPVTPGAKPATRPAAAKPPRPATPRPATGPFAPRPPGRHAPPRPGMKFPPRRFGPARRGPKRKSQPKQTAPKTPPPPPKFDSYKLITVAEGTTVRDLAEKMSVKSSELIGRLLGRGVMATINTSLDPEMAGAVAKEFGFELKTMGFEDHALMQEQEATKGEHDTTRPPIVTIMGHVDHGKTTLLDALRESNIVAREHGGITQHIGAYTIQGKGRTITFLDTPGHEAFTLMRARGAQVTDIVVLVVAADDGVMPQTIEAINHARAADVPIVVAINKMDRPDANPDRVKKELADRDVLVESWGGETVCVEISAKEKKGLDDVIEMIHLVADMKELKADPNLPASGTIIEARLDKARGAVATVLVQQGTLNVGDHFIAGSVTGKVRAMYDDRSRKVAKADPSFPVEILGLQGVPSPGDRFKAVENEAKARRIVSYRQEKIREEQLQKSSRMTLDHLHEQIQEGKVKELNLILKGDVQGSIEAVSKTLERLSNDDVKLRFIHQAVGAVNESDVLLASTSNAIVIGFNVRPDPNAHALAEKEGVEIRLHTVIYEVSDEIQKAMQGLLEPTYEEAPLGHAEVRNTFKVPKFGVIAGTFVVDGRMVRNADVRLLRDNVVVYQGKIASLRRFKEDVTEVKSGYECGLAIGNYSDIKVGDIIEAFKIEKVAPKTMVV